MYHELARCIVHFVSILTFIPTYFSQRDRNYLERYPGDKDVRYLYVSMIRKLELTSIREDNYNKSNNFTDCARSLRSPPTDWLSLSNDAYVDVYATAQHPTGASMVVATYCEEIATASSTFFSRYRQFTQYRSVNAKHDV